MASMDKKIIKNITTLFLEKIITIILVFYSEGMIARMLSIEEYGQWIYSVNFILLLSALTLVVGSEVSVVSLARNKSISSQIMTATFLIRLISSLVAFLISIIYIQYFIDNETTKNFIFVLAFFLIFSEPFGVISNYFQANINIFPIVVIRIFGLIIRTITILTCFYFFQENKLLIPLSRILEILIVSLCLISLVFYLRDRLKFSINYYIIKIILYRGLKFWPALLFMYLFQRLDRFFVETYFSYETLSQYGIAVQLMEQAFLLIGIVVQSISPKLIYAKMAKVELKKNIFILLGITILVSAIFYMLGYIFIPYIIEFIYGEKYALSSEFARVMLIALFFFSIDTVVMQYLYREKMAYYILIKWVIFSAILSISYYIAFDYLQISSLTLVYITNYLLMAIFSMFILLKRLKNEN